MSISFEIRASNFFLSSCLFLLCLGLYFPTVGYEFTFDDIIQIHENAYVRSDNFSLSQVFSVFAKATPPGDLYRPLVSFSFRLNNLMADGTPWVFHLTNVLIYASIVVLVYLLVLNFFKEKSLAFLAGLIFALQPVHVEAVANVYGRTELLAALFGLLSLGFYIKLFPCGKLYQWLLCPLFFFLAVISKESALTLLLIAPLYVYFQQNTKIKALILPTALLFAMALIYLGLRYLTLRDSFFIKAPNELYQQENPLFYVGFWQRIWPSFFILGKYIQLMIFPNSLSADYSFPEKDIQAKISSPEGIIYALIGLALPLLAFIFHRYRIKNAGFWTLWILCSFALTLNLIVPIGTFYAERLAFMPSIGVAVLITLILKFIFSTNSIRIFSVLIFGIYLSFLSYKTIDRMPVWQNNTILFDRTYWDNPYSSKAAMVRGVHHFKAANYRIAAESFKEAIFRDPSYTVPGKYLVVTYYKLNDFARAAYWAMKYLQVDPKDAEVQRIYKILQGLSPQQES